MGDEEKKEISEPEKKTPISSGLTKTVDNTAGTSSGKTNIEIDVYRYLVIGVIIALFIGVIGVFVALDIFVVDSFRSRETTYQDLKEEVLKQNLKIDDLNKTINLICKVWRKDCPNQ